MDVGFHSVGWSMKHRSFQLLLILLFLLSYCSYFYKVAKCLFKINKYLFLMIFSNRGKYFVPKRNKSDADSG